MPPPFRVSPTMGSSKLAALAFIRQFIADWGKGPSLSEISAGIGRSRDTAKRAVRRLAVDGDIIRSGGERGIRLPELPRLITTAEAVARLRAEGYIVNEDVCHVDLPTGPLAVPRTNPPLPLMPALEHIPGIDLSGGHHGIRRGGDKRARG